MPQRIIYPVLNIFVGTSPTAVAQQLTRELRHLDSTDQRKVAMLSVDTMPIQEERLNGHRSYGANTMQIIIPRYETKHAWSEAMQFHMRVSGPNHEHKAGIGAAGAGGVRNNGHVAFCSWASAILQRISDKLQQIISPPPHEQHERAPASLRINIITFLGGGTGSGILPALALLSRYALQQKNVVPQTAIYAVLPEQPRGLNEDMQRRQRSNAFATLLELCALLQLSGRDPRQVPHMWFGPLEMDVNGMHLVDVIYLYGHGHLSNHEDIYQHIGMDLFQRIQDGHGAGFERMRQLPDLSNLIEGDDRGLPTCFATSGVIEVIFPREEVIAAFALQATQTVLHAQTSELSREGQVETEKYSRELAGRMLASLESRLLHIQQQHVPGQFDYDIIHYGEGWWEELEETQANYANQLRLERAAQIRELKEDLIQQIQNHVLDHRSATFDRYVRIYDWLYQLVKKAREDVRPAEGAGRDHELEQRCFGANRWFRRRAAGSFINYANGLLDVVVEECDRRSYIEALQELEDWLRDESQRRSQMLELFRRTDSSSTSKADLKLLNEGKLPIEHPYARLALPSPGMMQACYLSLLKKMRLERDSQLDVNKVLDTIQKSHPLSSGELSRQMLDKFFREGFRKALEVPGEDGKTVRPRTIVEIVLDLECGGGEHLLRQHIAWGIEWARGHLDYNAYQEPRTNGRIARQFDVAAMLSGTRTTLQQMLDEENRRSEVQHGLKLIDSIDPDRIVFLYTEYAIPIRAIKGMHEDDNSYLKDYLENQRKWKTNGTMPTHSSNRMQMEVAGRMPQSVALAPLFADSPDRIVLDDLYPNPPLPGQLP